MKFVSVIIPTKNRVQLLEQAILSVLTQPYSRFEFTIVEFTRWILVNQASLAEQ